ncbi:hypothetical protein LC609_17800 [Nostoc sp. XA013]|nr:hypothetical protein [Nostoc sp. XA013]
MLRFLLPVLLLLGTPAIAVEFKGQNIDGQKLPARAYYYATGGVYKVQVRFHKKRATIYFDDGNQITIQLNQQVITDSNNIEGFGKIGQYPLTYSPELNSGDSRIKQQPQSQTVLHRLT